jgi:hypothetical protein
MDLNGTVLGNLSIPGVSHELLKRMDLFEIHILDFITMKIPRKPQNAEANFPAAEKERKKEENPQIRTIRLVKTNKPTSKGGAKRKKKKHTM